MVVIVIVSDRNGRPSRPSRGKKVTYVSSVHIKPALFSAQVEPGETIATTKEGKFPNFTFVDK